MGSFESDALPAEAKAFVSEEDCKHAHTHAHTRMRTHMVFLCSAHKLHTHTHTGLSLVSGGVGRSGREADASQTSNAINSAFRANVVRNADARSDYDAYIEQRKSRYTGCVAERRTHRLRQKKEMELW